MGRLPLGWWPIYEKQGRPGTGAGRRRQRPFPVVTGGEVSGGLQIGLHGGGGGGGVTHFGAAGRTGLTREASRR
jgi:hypothetical protein